MTYRIIYEGKVQGVGFRASVLSLAKGYDVTGGVKNLPDGRVELLLQGDSDEIEDFLRGIRESHLSGHIQQESNPLLEEPPSPPFRGFKILS